MVGYGPFVMNTREEIVAAIRDYQAGRTGVIPPMTLDAVHPGVRLEEGSA